MGLLDGMLGNASKIDPLKIQQEFAQILAPGESVEHAYQLIRDYFVFTDKRFVLVDKQGATGSKVEYHSTPYRFGCGFVVGIVFAVGGWIAFAVDQGYFVVALALLSGLVCGLAATKYGDAFWAWLSRLARWW